MTRVSLVAWLFGGLILGGCAGPIRSASEPTSSASSEAPAASTPSAAPTGLFETSTPAAPPLLPDMMTMTGETEPPDESVQAASTGPVRIGGATSAIALPKPPVFPSKRKAKARRAGTNSG